MKNLRYMKISPDMQYEIGQDKVRIFPEWSIKDDSTLLKKVKDLAHSTFDRSKFTIIGSPVITDNGIASGFTTGNGVKASVSVNNASSVTLKGRFIYTSGGTIEQVVLQGINSVSSADKTTTFYCVLTDSQFKIDATINGTWTRLLTKNFTTTLTTGDIVDVEYTLTQTNVSYSVYTNGVLNIADTQNVSCSPFVVDSFSSITTHATNSISATDLKYFSITADGVPVFSGNKTGIDTVKPDDYTVVGTPTISADGIITSTAESYCVTSSIISQIGNSAWKLEFKGYAPEEQIQASIMGRSWADQSPISIKRYTASSTLNVYIRGQSDYIISTTVTAVAGALVEGYMEYDGASTYTLYIDVNGTNVKNQTFTSTDKIKSNTTYPLTIGGYNSYGVDLNSIKVYINNNLVYQPCLKIPYTEGICNKKIVTSLYRNRVKDLFFQAGYNSYFTLDAENLTFTLPTHNGNDIVEFYENNAVYWELRADLMLTEQGTCENGTEVVLPKPYKDTNYFLSVPYSQKTASSFVPSVSGNWFSRGKCCLA